MLRLIGPTILITAVLALAGDAVAAEPVKLSDARVAPDALFYVLPGSDSPQVPDCATDLSAYRWNGRALGAQERRPALFIWRGKRGRVEFDGIRFYNFTAKPVLVAAWCA